MKIGCAILAGGKSSRMGTDKALLEIDGKNFIEQISGELSWFNERIIARGNNRELPETIASTWTVIPDVYPDHGPIGGIHAALAACESDALFVVTCDMPFLKGALARRLCESMICAGPDDETDVTCPSKRGCEWSESEPYDAVVAVEEGGRVHPLCGVYGKSALPVLEEQILSERNKIMAVLDKLRVKYVTIDSSVEAQQLSNINTPQDYEKLKQIT